MILIPLIITSFLLIGVCGLADAFWSLTSDDYRLRKQYHPQHYLFPYRATYNPNLAAITAAIGGEPEKPLVQDWAAIGAANDFVRTQIAKEVAAQGAPTT